jgi:hypothetical protein
MENNTTYEKYYKVLLNAVSRMNNLADGKDLPRNHTAYGMAAAYASVLRDLGHEVDICVYGDGDYLVSAKLVVDGETKIDFEK